ncbi:hypothetical protein [Actinomadura fibrosa]|uniref:LamG domain-containing protein n=1 Tax=Actinomadura fibrosa TaxID=111802 RepID=A0ABW2Y2Z9_9ACTN|nr:hypothetical protein [Actinomadura fibrosa]
MAATAVTVTVAAALLAATQTTALAATTVFSENFQTTPTGPLGAPWSISRAGGSTAAVVDTPDHGRVLELRGSPASGDFLIASRAFSSSATEVRYTFAVNPAAGASFVTALNGAGSSIGSRRIRLERDPGSTTLTAQTTPSGTSACGTLPSGTWSTVTLQVHAAASPHTFDVLLNGAPTKCTGITTGLGAPFTGLNVMDASNDGFGGTVRFDDLLVTAP